LAAGGLIFVGAWVYKEYQHYEELTEARYTLVPATIMMAVGVFFFVLGLVGCVGAFKEQKCLLGLFFSLLLIIFVGLVAGAVLAYVYRSKIDTAVHKQLSEGVSTMYGNPNETTWTDEIDFMQSELKCCGVNNYTDWKTSDWYTEYQNGTHFPYPNSCCENQKCNYKSSNETTGVYPNGCHGYLKDQFLIHLGVIAGVAAAFALVQILGMVCSCVLICRRKSEVPYIGLNEPNGMRV